MLHSLGHYNHRSQCHTGRGSSLDFLGRHSLWYAVGFFLSFFFQDLLKFIYLLGFSRVDQIPATIWRSDPNANTGIEMSRWLIVVCGLIFFAFFGFADEAQRHYKIAFDSVVKRVGNTTTTGSTKIGTGITSSTGYVHIIFRRRYVAYNTLPVLTSSRAVLRPLRVRKELVYPSSSARRWSKNVIPSTLSPI